MDVFRSGDQRVGLKLRLRFSWLRPDFITERNVQAWLDGSKSAIQTQIQRVFLFQRSAVWLWVYPTRIETRQLYFTGEVRMFGPGLSESSMTRSKTYLFALQLSSSTVVFVREAATNLE